MSHKNLKTTRLTLLKTRLSFQFLTVISEGLSVTNWNDRRVEERETSQWPRMCKKNDVRPLNGEKERMCKKICETSQWPLLRLRRAPRAHQPRPLLEDVVPTSPLALGFSQPPPVPPTSSLRPPFLSPSDASPRVVQGTRKTPSEVPGRPVSAAG